MRPYTGPPACTRCGGALLSDGEACACGGGSQYAPRSMPEAYIDPETALALIPREEPRGLSWREAFDQLMSRYAPE